MYLSKLGIIPNYTMEMENRSFLSLGLTLLDIANEFSYLINEGDDKQTAVKTLIADRRLEAILSLRKQKGNEEKLPTLREISRLINPSLTLRDTKN
jgi:hypothetical protein